MNHIDPKVLVFDFDGVIISHSEFFKEDAWKEVFKKYKGKYESYFEEASGLYGFGKKGDRFDILRHIFEKLAVEDIEKEVQNGAKTFDAYIQEKILAAGVVRGVPEALESFGRMYPLYLNTGTAQSGIDKTIINLDLRKYFKGVLGGPESKADNLRSIAEIEHVALNKLLLIGDSDGDVHAANETDCQFVGIGNEWNGWVPGIKSFPVIDHIKNVRVYL